MRALDASRALCVPFRPGGVFGQCGPSGPPEIAVATGAATPERVGTVRAHPKHFGPAPPHG